VLRGRAHLVLAIRSGHTFTQHRNIAVPFRDHSMLSILELAVKALQ
jgi:hypothetical protein